MWWICGVIELKGRVQLVGVEFELGFGALYVSLVRACIGRGEEEEFGTGCGLD